MISTREKAVDMICAKLSSFVLERELALGRLYQSIVGEDLEYKVIEYLSERIEVYTYIRDKLRQVKDEE